MRQNVLFLCTGNSARSQMAEGLLRDMDSEHFVAHSAGLEPKGVHPLSVFVMDEIGIDIRAQRAKDVAEYLGRLAVHHLITVCDHAASQCPTAWPGLRDRVHWAIDDPASVADEGGARLATFRAVRDELRSRIRAWLATQPWLARRATQARGAQRR